MFGYDIGISGMQSLRKKIELNQIHYYIVIFNEENK
jgi:hypothetical protein